MKNIYFAAAVAASVISFSTVAAGASAPSHVAPRIAPLCVVADDNTAYWTVSNDNETSVNIDWTAVVSGYYSNYDAPAGNTTFATYYDAADNNNVTEFSYQALDPNAPDGVEIDSVTRNSSNTECTPEQIPAQGNEVPTPTPTPTPTPGQASGAVTTPAPVQGGKGGGTLTPALTTTPLTTLVPAPAAATDKAPQLANTGASRMLPYSVATIIAVFTLVATALVRKNVI